MKFGSKNRPRSWLDQDITNLRLSILILGQNFSSSKKSVLNDRRYDLPVEIGRKIRNLFCAGITVGAMWIRNGICAIQMWCWLFCCWLHYRKNRCSFPLFKDGQKIFFFEFLFPFYLNSLHRIWHMRKFCVNTM